MTETPETRAARAVDETRLWDRLMTMASYGALANGGVNRQALSPEDVAARRRMKRWADARGFQVTTDGIGNLFVRRPGSDPEAAPVMTGSHMDSQPTGGKFDGIYGVLAGLEALCALEDAGVATRRPIEVVAWTNEEGSRFRPGVMGSSVFAGRLALDDALGVADGDGITVASALAEVRAAETDIPVRDMGGPVASYIEAHIEQGPVLEAAGKTVGVVTGIQGIRWFDVEVTGREDHAGTTPLKTRKDALKAATGIVTALGRALADPDDVVRFTVGRFEAFPGAPSTVPGRVVFTIDLRHPDGATIERLSAAIAKTSVVEAAGCEVAVRETMNAAPTIFPDEMVATVRRHAEALEISHLELPSGAGHDAMNMHGLCPTGMVFIPCENGISHNEAEAATPGDCAAGARVLTACLTDLANR
ncbi:MAG: M20 family metallo-hydrolase [Alphaproteobacteria bacterium]|nr:M20 family metallo-hydrolase [Alphaproteobacteria bacterium]